MAEYADIISFFIAAFLGGFIGWITNWLAIKALFHPYKPFKFLFFEFQGLLPKRQKELGENLGKIVEGELINVKELVKRVDPSDLDPIIEAQMHSNRERAEEKVKDLINGIVSKVPFVSLNPESLSKPLMDKIETEVIVALKRQVPGIIDKSAEKAAESISVKEIVSEKVQQMDMDKLEALINKISDKEMKMIVRLGGVLGVLVGSLHWVIQHLLLG